MSGSQAVPRYPISSAAALEREADAQNAVNPEFLWPLNELLGGIPTVDYSQIADHLNRVFYTTVVTNYAADFSVA